MCGTAAISRALADHGFAVTAADELLFPTLHAKARLLPVMDKQFQEIGATYLQTLARLNAARPEQGFFWREYGSLGSPVNGREPRLYFTADNAGRIDAVRRKIRRWSKAGLPDSARDLLLHDLILAANRVANIAGTYGYFRSTWSGSSLSRLELRPTPKPPRSARHRVVQGKVEELAAVIEADGCYLDPPYTKRQYGGNYHIPETLARQDDPDPVGDGGLRDWYPQSSKFCLRREAPEAMRETIKLLDVPWIFISYSEDGQILASDLRDLLSEFGKVRRTDLQIPRFRSNAGAAEGFVTEHLYVLEK
jgi:adenine-specific DNA-methyltransferase